MGLQNRVFFEVPTSSFLIPHSVILLLEEKVTSKLSWLWWNWLWIWEDTINKIQGRNSSDFCMEKICPIKVSRTMKTLEVSHIKIFWLQNQIRKMILMTLIMADFLTSSKWPKRPLHDKNWLIIFNYERTNKQMMDDIFGDGTSTNCFKNDLCKCVYLGSILCFLWLMNQANQACIIMT